MSEKEKIVLAYCKKHIEYMWAAVIAGMILNVDFRESKKVLEEMKDV